MSLERPTRAQMRALDQIREDGGMICTLSSDCSRQYTTVAGNPVNFTVACNLIIRGFVKPNGDGLVSGFNQSWSAAYVHTPRKSHLPNRSEAGGQKASQCGEVTAGGGL